MAKNTKPRDGKPGTTDQWPRWEGPEENRPRGYLPAKDNPDIDRNAAGENLQDPEKSDLTDAFKRNEEFDLPREERVRQRAYDSWDRRGRPEGTHDEDWFNAAREIDGEIGETAEPALPEQGRRGPVDE